MTTTLGPLFETAVRAFESGELTSVARLLKTPTTIYFRERMMFVQDEDMLLMILRTYRDNLVFRGYARTRADVQDETDAGQDKLRLRLRCTHFDGAGDQISSIVGTYYCSRYADGMWRVSLVEYERPPSDDLTLGLKIV